MHFMYLSPKTTIIALQLSTLQLFRQLFLKMECVIFGRIHMGFLKVLFYTNLSQIAKEHTVRRCWSHSINHRMDFINFSNTPECFFIYRGFHRSPRLFSHISILFIAHFVLLKEETPRLFAWWSIFLLIIAPCVKDIV